MFKLLLCKSRYIFHGADTENTIEPYTAYNLHQQPSFVLESGTTTAGGK